MIFGVIGIWNQELVSLPISCDNGSDKSVSSTWRLKSELLWSMTYYRALIVVKHGNLEVGPVADPDEGR